MKKSKFSLLTLLLAVVVLLSGCDAWVTNQDAVKPTNSHTIPPATDPDGNVDPNPFTCTLIYNDAVFIPKEPIEILWNDGYTMRSAPIGADGVARCGGLDGDYRVTLANLPEGYYYNPNINFADNNKRNIEIQLHKLVPTQGSGMNLYSDCIKVRNTGVYCVEIQQADVPVYFEFVPTEAGLYSVESWMDTVADEVDPGATRYTESFAYKVPLSYHDEGGEEGTYTKNFKMDVRMADEYYGEGGETAASFTFGIRATAKDGRYPIKIYIAVTLDGEFRLPHVESELMIPKELSDEPQKNYPGYTFVYPERVTTPGAMPELDGDRFKLWPKEEGGDGYYHLFDAAAYPETFGYGPILYADITEACRFVMDAFSKLEYHGNKALTVSNGTENYKLFIEGFSGLTGGGSATFTYFCRSDCPCFVNRTCESVQIANVNGACTEDCKTCLEGCRRCPAEVMGQGGYAQHVNSDGRHAVTQELKEFLHKFSTSQQLFFDGEGYAETHPQYPIFATEDDQWLFACGYYVKK